MWALVLALSLASPIADETLIKVSGVGKIQGHYVRDGKVIQWLGIPYAAPPVGPLRFSQPKPAVSWGDNIYNANEVKPGCPQNCTILASACPAVTSEDCLFLNIWSPSRSQRLRIPGSTRPKVPTLSQLPSLLSSPLDPPTKNRNAVKSFLDSYIPLSLLEEDSTTGLPVYVFIHGGMFTAGHGGSRFTNGSLMAEEGVVVVTFNYRLGALGFLSRNEIGGNFGFMDQILALRWVQNHIGAFGGDPETVTLGGQSAGAISVALHMTCPQSDGLFHRVILESPLLGLPMFSQQQASYELGNDFVYKVGCTSSDAAQVAECLRNVSIADIIDAQQYSATQISSVRKLFGSPFFSSLVNPWAPVISDLIPDQPLNSIRKGLWRKTPAIAGFTRDEFASFTPILVPELGKYSYSALIYAYFGLRASNRILENYPASDAIPDQRDMISEVTRDMFVSCPLRFVTRNDTLPAYLYRFDHVFDDSRLWGEMSGLCAHFACHSAELPVIFSGKSAALETNGTLTAEEMLAAEQLHRYFVRFIKTGDPNDSTDFPWPKSVGAGPYLRLESPFSISAYAVDQKKCDLWDEIGYFW